jgi:hypothetical protein
VVRPKKEYVEFMLIFDHGLLKINDIPCIVRKVERLMNIGWLALLVAGNLYAFYTSDILVNNML